MQTEAGEPAGTWEGGRQVCRTEPLVKAESRAEGCVDKKGVALGLQLAGSPAEMERGWLQQRAAVGRP